MGSDRSRRTYDEAKQYRRVVPQQGRVVLEADSNEAYEIQSEAARTALIDVIGPVGVPSDPIAHTPGTGYAVQTPEQTTRDFSIGAGPIYLGGSRVLQEKDGLKYSKQPDWLDGPAPVQANAGHEVVYLRLREQEVSAAEDSTLREVALGGPDTANRVRLVRHVERFACTGTDCSAFEEVLSAWQAQGLDYDPKTSAISPRARLQVSIENLTGTPSPCDPTASNGYLGAENQLIRVQISSPGTFLWSYDNASFIYRVDVLDNAGKTLKLRSIPVDAFHQPKKGQFVEVLRAAAELSGDDFVAADYGRVQILATGYDGDTHTITLSQALTADEADKTKTPALFVRVWENQQTIVTAATPLIDFSGNHTGLQITLSSGPFVPGTFWSFAVRPTTPTNVYPARYLAAAQPAEGPRQWASPLGVIDWTHPVATVSDCRPSFDDLVTLTAEIAVKQGGGCCTVTLKPDDLTGTKTLQTVIDGFKNAKGARVTICLLPGTYNLPAPLTFGPDHEYLTLEGCHDGAILQAAPGAELKFLQGLVVMTHADNLTFRRLRFHLPLVDFTKAGGTLAAHPLAALDQLGVNNLTGLRTSIGIRPMHCANLEVSDCLFRFAIAEGQDLFGAGIFAGSECWGMTLEHNRFLHDEDYLRIAHDPPRMIFGLLLVPSDTLELRGRNVSGGTVVRSLLSEARICQNLFSGLTAAVLAYADLGSIRLDQNRVRSSYAGFCLVSLRTALFDPKAMLALQRVFSPASFVVDHPLMSIGAAIGRAYPVPADLPARHVRKVPIAPPLSFVNLHVTLAALEERQFRTIELTEKALPLLHTALHCSDNDVEAAVNAGMSAAAFLVWGNDLDHLATVLLNGNRLRSNGGGPTAQLIHVPRSAITGNVILNEGDADGLFSDSLTVFAGTTATATSGIAVTGNVFRGPTVLPTRAATLPVDLRDWSVLNTTLG